MQCYVLVSDFVYDVGKDGKTYGWGVTEYSTPEISMGKILLKKSTNASQKNLLCEF